MSLVSVNGKDVFRAKIRLPRFGAWLADVKADVDGPVDGPATIVVDGGALTLVGTVARGGEFADVASSRIVAGAAGLGRAARPQHYASPSVQIVLSDLMAASGERLASSADASVTGAGLPAWTSAAVSCGKLLRRMLGVVGSDVVWRHLPDGTIWVGRETWPDSGLQATDFEVLEQDDEHGWALLGLDVPTLLPGTTLLGRRVSYVEHVVESNVRTRVWYADAGETVDRYTAAVQGMVGAALPDFDYSGLHLAKIVGQEGQTIDVVPVDQDIPPMGSVPLLVGLPGAALAGVIGGVALVGWSGRDPSRSFACLFGGDAAAASIALGTPAYPVLRLTPSVVTWLAAVGTGSSAGPPPADIASALLEVA